MQAFEPPRWMPSLVGSSSNTLTPRDKKLLHRLLQNGDEQPETKATQEFQKQVNAILESRHQSRAYLFLDPWTLDQWSILILCLAAKLGGSFRVVVVDTDSFQMQRRIEDWKQTVDLSQVQNLTFLSSPSLAEEQKSLLNARASITTWVVWPWHPLRTAWFPFAAQMRHMSHKKSSFLVSWSNPVLYQEEQARVALKWLFPSQTTLVPVSSSSTDEKEKKPQVKWDGKQTQGQFVGSLYDDVAAWILAWRRVLKGHMHIFFPVIETQNMTLLRDVYRHLNENENKMQNAEIEIGFGWWTQVQHLPYVPPGENILVVFPDEVSEFYRPILESILLTTLSWQPAVWSLFQAPSWGWDRIQRIRGSHANRSHAVSMWRSQPIPEPHALVSPPGKERLEEHVQEIASRLNAAAYLEKPRLLLCPTSLDPDQVIGQIADALLRSPEAKRDHVAVVSLTPPRPPEAVAQQARIKESAESHLNASGVALRYELKESSTLDRPDLKENMFLLSRFRPFPSWLKALHGLDRDFLICVPDVACYHPEILLSFLARHQGSQAAMYDLLRVRSSSLIRVWSRSDLEIVGRDSLEWMYVDQRFLDLSAVNRWRHPQRVLVVFDGPLSVWKRQFLFYLDAHSQSSLKTKILVFHGPDGVDNQWPEGTEKKEIHQWFEHEIRVSSPVLARSIVIVDWDRCDPRAIHEILYVYRQSSICIIRNLTTQAIRQRENAFLQNLDMCFRVYEHLMSGSEEDAQMPVSRLVESVH